MELKSLGDGHGVVGGSVIDEDDAESVGALDGFGFDIPEELGDDATFIKAGKYDAKRFFHEQATRDDSIRA